MPAAHEERAAGGGAKEDIDFVGNYNGGGGPAYYDWVRVSD